MKINCVWEHNGGSSLLYATDYIGAYTRGESKEAAISKMPTEILAYARWRGDIITAKPDIVITQEKISTLDIRDADSDVIFDEEKAPLSLREYNLLKTLALRSAEDFALLYRAIPDKDQSCLLPRTTFYGHVPRTASEMYEHTKNVNSYYFGELGVEADNDGAITDCRKKGFERLEAKRNFLCNTVVLGSYGEEWSVRKVLRRFIWHDRIHAKAMYRMATKTFGAEAVPDIFAFNI